MQSREKQLRVRDVQDVIELIGGRWRGAILASLCESPKRFLELKTELPRITPRALIKELRYLEMNMMVTVERNTVAGNSVTYILTKHGKSIEALIAEMQSWAARHRKKILGKE